MGPKLHDVRPISMWKERFFGPAVSFPYTDMAGKRQVYDRGKEQRLLDERHEKRSQRKQHLHLDFPEGKKRVRNNARIDYGEAESAEKMKRKDYDEFDDTGNEGFGGERKGSSDFEEKVKEFKEGSDFDEQRYNLDSSNINSPIAKKEIVFNCENSESKEFKSFEERIEVS